MMIDNTYHYILIIVSMALVFIQDHRCVRQQKLLCSFLIHMSSISRVPDQNGVSQAWYIVEIHHSGRKPSIWIYVMNRVLLAVLHDKNFNFGHYMQTFQPNVFISAMLIGTIDFSHFLGKFSVSFDEIQKIATTCWFVEARAKFI